MSSDLDPTILLILLTALCVGAVYAAILERLKSRYSPDYTWLTVVVGNALIGFHLAAFCFYGIVQWRAFWLLLALNISIGIPIIVWQVGQAYARRAVRQRRNGDRHGDRHGPAH